MAVSLNAYTTAQTQRANAEKQAQEDAARAKEVSQTVLTDGKEKLDPIKVAVKEIASHYPSTIRPELEALVKKGVEARKGDFFLSDDTGKALQQGLSDAAKVRPATLDSQATILAHKAAIAVLGRADDIIIAHAKNETSLPKVADVAVYEKQLDARFKAQDDKRLAAAEADKKKTDVAAAEKPTDKTAAKTEKTFAQGTTLSHVATNEDEQTAKLRATVKTALGEKATAKDITAAMVVAIAETNKIADIDHIKAGATFRLPTDAEMKASVEKIKLAGHVDENGHVALAKDGKRTTLVADIIAPQTPKQAAPEQKGKDASGGRTA